MVPETRAAHQPESLAAFLRQHLNLPLDFEAAGLTVERIADIAVLAVSHAEGYAATAHLASLVAGLPIPVDKPHDFWFQLWQASGSAIFMPPNIKHQVLRALQGDGDGLADQMLTAVSGMSAEQRSAAAVVIGQGLEGERHVTGYSVELLGELWLRDIEMTAWRVLYASSQRPTWEAQAKFREGWKNYD
ncbi:hypothetical protein ACFY2W_36050 [Streptomyces sp. NPDC001262]|uniref:hypothetical protein n=1 Tax=Streptomyces sp. NPDC001262 TaxID=3364552 RepID=UPI0036B67C81